MKSLNPIENEIISIYQSLKNKNSNLVLELMPRNDVIYEWQHYPKGDVKDHKHFSQYYYHAHPSKDSDRVKEHGHFHIFYRADRFSQKDSIITTSEKYKSSNGKSDNLTHLLAIAMNESGYPTALFTVNYWVVTGVWYPAQTLIKYLDDFIVDIENSEYSLTNAWISNMVKLFKPQIIELLTLRDKVIENFQQNNPDKNVFYTKDLEITSVLSFCNQ